MEAGQVSADWRKAIVSPSFKKGKLANLGNHRWVNFISAHGKIMFFFSSRLSLMNLIAFYAKQKRTVFEGRAGDVIYLNFVSPPVLAPMIFSYPSQDGIFKVWMDGRDGLHDPSVWMIGLRQQWLMSSTLPRDQQQVE